MRSAMMTVCLCAFLQVLLAVKKFGRLRLFVNGETLTGVRQTRWDPMLRPTRATDGRRTVAASASLDGRTINGGLRVRF